QVRVEVRPELLLQEADVAARPFDRVERVSARDPGARRADRMGLVQDVFVPQDALLVREDDVLVHLLVGDGAVEAVEGTEARDEEDHLGPVRALAAADRQAAAGESAEGSFLEAHAASKGRRGIKIPWAERGPDRPTPAMQRTSKWRYAPRSGPRSSPAVGRTLAPPSDGRPPSAAGVRIGPGPNRRGRRSPPSSSTDRRPVRSARSRSISVRRSRAPARRNRFPFSYLSVEVYFPSPSLYVGAVRETTRPHPESKI